MAAEIKLPDTIGIIMLAAGASARLGRPKQWLPYKNNTLLQHSVDAALASCAKAVVVVLGSGSETNQHEITGDKVQVVTNTEWKEGMASSIRCGIKKMRAIHPMADGGILMVCDQPFVTPALLNELVAAHQKTGKPVVACGYDDTFGPPVFFHHTLFDELLQLKGDIGARRVVRQHADLAEIIPFPEGRFDVDTEKDYERLTGQGEA